MAESKAENYSVYILESPEGKKYVGCTGNYPWARWCAGNGYQSNKRLWADIQKFGWDNFKRTIVRSGMQMAEAAEMEKRLIEDLQARDEDKGYNTREGGEGLFRGQKPLKTFEQILEDQELTIPLTKEEIEKIWNDMSIL